MKTFHQLFQYVYLGISLFFLYSAYAEYASGGTKTIFYILIAAAALAMFFFKRHMLRKMNGDR